MLRARDRLLYGLGDVAIAVKTIVSALYTLFFWSTVTGLSGTLVGIGSAVGLAWDALIDPLIGSRSDRSRSRFGRRHGFMLAGALGMGPAFLLFFGAPRGLSTAALFVWFVVSGLLLRGAMSLFAVPYAALGAELSDDYDDRTRITAVRGALALVGTLAAASLSFLVFFPDAAAGDTKLEAWRYRVMALAFGAAMGGTALIATLATRRHAPPLPAPAAAGGSRGAPAGALLALRNPPFRRLLISTSLFFFGVVFNTALSVHWVTYYAGVTSNGALALMQFALYAGALAGIVVWLRIGRSVDKHRLYLVAVVATAAFAAAGTLLVGEGRWLGVDRPLALAAGHGVAGFFVSVLWFLPPSMVADVAAWERARGGRCGEGAFFGVLSFGQQVATGLCVLLAGVALDAYAGFVPGAADQTVTAVRRLGHLYGLVPAALLTAAAAVMVGYPLTRARMERNEANDREQRAGDSTFTDGGSRVQ